MRLMGKLIQLHKSVFLCAMVVMFLSEILNLCWNNILAQLIDCLGGNNIPSVIISGTIGITVLLMISEFAASWLAAYTCELFAHEMRVGYARFYLQGDVRVISGLNAEQEQSAMQNELSEISNYMNEQLFSFIRQCVSFLFTVFYLAEQSIKLTMVAVLPVIPLMIYCAFSGKVIKSHTEKCQEEKGKMNGLFGVLLELFPVIQTYDAHQLVYAAWNQGLDSWKGSNVKKERVAAKLMSLSGVLSMMPLLCMLGVGGIMVMTGEITVGIFYIFINLSGNVSGFLQNMPGIYARWKQFDASVGRIGEKICLK